MEKHNTPLWLENMLIIACAAMAIYICFFADIAEATPFLWVDTVNGDDASVDPYNPNTPLRTYARAIALGADGDTIGVKIKPRSAAPTAEEAFVIISRKPDVVRTHRKKEVIAGHGELPDVDVIESTEAGIKITQQWVWEIFTAPNGQIAERCINITTTTEDY